MSNDILERRLTKYSEEFISTVLRKNTSQGNEGLYDVIAKTLDDVRVLSKTVFHLGKMLVPLFIMSGRRMQHAFSSYHTLNEKYYSTLRNINFKMDNEKFESTKIKTVPFSEMEKRIQVASALHHFVENTSAVCENNIDLSHDDAWLSRDVMNIHKALLSIGINLGQFGLSESPKIKYSERDIKASMNDLGYSQDNLTDLISELKKLSKYADKNEFKKLTDNIAKYFLQITEQEKKLEHLENIDEEARENITKTIEIKTIRLWTVSQCLKVMSQLCTDVSDDVLKISRIAINSEEKQKEELTFE